MIIDGEKWACEACVRGHRVSNCQHSERPLQHINKKGRPVSQCGHCRAMRKSRSSHIKCDCGEKTHKCIHLQQPREGHKDSCCCNHGKPCTCSHKKEPQLDPVPESESDQESAPKPKAVSPKATYRRRRANTANSDSALSVDSESGVYRPTYRASRTLHKSGQTTLSRVNSARSAGVSSNRSAENLLRSGPQSIRDIPSDAIQGRQVRSETTSPQLTSGSFGQHHSRLPKLDLSRTDYQHYLSGGFDNMFSSNDADTALFSAGLTATPVDWSHIDYSTSRTAENFAPSNYSQPQSYGGFEFNGSEQAPTLTTTGSGDVSEAEDWLGTSLDEWEPAAFGSSLPGPGFGMASSSFLAPVDDTSKLLKSDSEFLPRPPPSLAGDDLTLSTGSSYSLFSEDPAIWMQDYHGLPPVRNSPSLEMHPWETQ